jgi:hypothetical protein
MKTYEILSKTDAGEMVAVVTTEATSDADALNKTANFCDMMSIDVDGVREVADINNAAFKRLDNEDVN